jgi:hypothetical protein
MAGPTVVVATSADSSASFEALEKALVEHGVQREGENTWVTRAFGAPLEEASPIVFHRPSENEEAALTEFSGILKLGAMANRPCDYAALVSLAISVASFSSGFLFLESWSQPTAQQGIVQSLKSTLHSGGPAYVTYSVLLTPEAAREWWLSGQLRLVK